MSLNADIERLEELCSALSTQAGSLTSTMLANDVDSVNNLKSEVEEAAAELQSGITELKGYVSIMETQKNTWSW